MKRFLICLLFVFSLSVCAVNGYADDLNIPDEEQYEEAESTTDSGKYKIPLFKEVRETIRKCWVCEIFETFMAVINRASYNVAFVLKGPLLQLLALGFAFWVLFTIISYFTSFGVAEKVQLVSSLFVKTLQVLIAGAFLAASGHLAVDYIISPPLDFTLGVMNSAFQPDIKTASLTARLTEGIKRSNAKYCDPGVRLITGDKKKDAFIFSEQMQKKMLCVVDTIEYQFMGPFMVGRFLWGVARGETKKIRFTSIRVPKFKYFLPAIFLMMVFGVMMCIVPLYLLDYLMRIGIIVILLPVLIVAAVFNSTREYVTSTAWPTIVESLFVFISLAATITIVMDLYDVMIAEHIEPIVEYSINDKISHLGDYFIGEAEPDNKGTPEGKLATGKGMWYVLLMIFAWAFLAFEILKLTPSLAKGIVGEGMKFDPNAKDEAEDRVNEVK